MTWGGLIGVGLGLLLAAFATAASADNAPWQGVWQGEIGHLPVRVCLTHRVYGDFGAYYYLSRLKTIRLERDAKTGDWGEGDADMKTATLTLRRLGHDGLVGEWRGGVRALDIGLHRVISGVADDDTPCASLAFNGPRTLTPVVSRKPAVKDGVAYTRLLVSVGKAFDATIESFQLGGASPAIARVNAALRKTVPVKPEGADYLECSMQALGSNGYDGSYSDVVSPAMITRGWLTASDASGGDCGGAHPSSGVSSRVFDLRTGAEVDLWTWFAPDAVKTTRADGYTQHEVQPGLKRAVLARWKGDDKDCRDTIAEPDGWDLALTRLGLAFTPELPHVVQACADPIIVPYRALAPFLTAAGRAGVASVLADLR